MTGENGAFQVVNTWRLSTVLTGNYGVPDLVHLVDAAQGGDRLAFGELYAQYARAVHGILLSRVPRAEVEDLVQDVFLTAMQRLGSLRDPAAFGGWLAAITRNRATDHLRRAHQTSSLTVELNGETLPAPGTGASHAVAAPDHAEALAVMAVIRTLPDAYRETLVLRLVEGMTGPEIADRTGLTAGSVRVNLYRGMKLLRERMAAVAP